MSYSINNITCYVKATPLADKLESVRLRKEKLVVLLLKSRVSTDKNFSSSCLC